MASAGRSGPRTFDGYDWTGRTGRRHRRLVLDHLAVAAFDDAAETGVTWESLQPCTLERFAGQVER